MSFARRAHYLTITKQLGEDIAVLVLYLPIIIFEAMLESRESKREPRADQDKKPLP